MTRTHPTSSHSLGEIPSRRFGRQSQQRRRSDDHRDLSTPRVSKSKRARWPVAHLMRRVLEGVARWWWAARAHLGITATQLSALGAAQLPTRHSAFTRMCQPRVFDVVVVVQAFTLVCCQPGTSV